ncbi:MAG: hypothetical protein ACI84C_000468 [Flavobacteriales bacterium]|jgi:hypothetical protein
MKLSSLSFSGKVESIYSTVDDSDFLTRKIDQLQLDFEGIPGDRHYGFLKDAGGRDSHYKRGIKIRNNRQWSAVSVEDLASISQKLEIPKLEPEWIGANILISGIPAFSQLPPFSHLRFYRDGKLQATLVVSEQNKPCRFPDRLIEAHSEVLPSMGFAKAGLNLRGLVGWVDQAGTILPGDEVKCEITPEGSSLMKS